MAKDFYATLGVERGSSADEIRRAYRKLAREHHPDVNPDRREEAEARFKEITEAYGVLSDENKRALYDRYGEAGLNGAGGVGADFGGGIGDLFEVFFGGAGGGGGVGGRAREDLRRGSDLRIDVSLSLEECWAGVTRELRVPAMLRCKTCNGDGSAPGSKPEVCQQCSGQGRVREVRNTFFGQFVQEAPCPRCAGRGKIVVNPCADCRGEGRVRDERRVTVSIPPGVDEGDRVRVTSAGEDGTQGAPAGDLYCFIYVERHELFQRHENDVLHVIPLSFPQATLGDVLKVPTLERNGDEPVMTEVTIPAGTQNGATFRLTGKGFTTRGGHRGDQICVARVVVPKKLTDRQRELLREWAEIEKEHPQEQPRGLFNRIKDVIGID